ncbi:hypothetical protein T09_11992 [Trichinella sp. T9]|nr:hypothetical protein T09_11992 [Trichinella sp. T9]
MTLSSICNFSDAFYCFTVDDILSFPYSNLCCPDVVCYEVLDIEDGLQSLDSLPMPMFVHRLV